MAKNMWVDDPYTNKARQEGYVARSVYKLEELDHKYHLFGPATTTVLDIWCAPGSWLQYVAKKLTWSHAQAIGFDLKPVEINLPHVSTYVQDITDREAVGRILAQEGIEQFDLILSDMAPDTGSQSDIDAMRSIALIHKTRWIYEKFLAPGGKFAIKIFMWPWFDQFVREMKDLYGASNIVVFKPKACRKWSKETYVVKRS